MSTTSPINGLPIPDDTSPNDPPIHFQGWSDVIDDRLNARFTSTADRDAKFAGKTIAPGTVAWVGSRQYAYNSGWQAVAAFLGSGTAFPSSAILGDTYYHQTLHCTMRYIGSGDPWRQQDIVATSDVPGFAASVTAAGLTMHNGFRVVDTATDVLYVADGSAANNLYRVASPGHLTQVTGGNSTAGTTNAVGATATVTIPSGLPSNRRIRVVGTAGISTPGGVGVIVTVGTTTTAATSRTISASWDGDVTCTYYDSDLTPGTRNYTIWLRSTVPGTINTWSPTLNIDIV